MTYMMLSFLKEKMKQLVFRFDTQAESVVSDGGYVSGISKSNTAIKYVIIARKMITSNLTVISCKIKIKEQLQIKRGKKFI